MGKQIDRASVVLFVLPISFFSFSIAALCAHILCGLWCEKLRITACPLFLDYSRVLFVVLPSKLKLIIVLLLFLLLLMSLPCRRGSSSLPLPWLLAGLTKRCLTPYWPNSYPCKLFWPLRVRFSCCGGFPRENSFVDSLSIPQTFIGFLLPSVLPPLPFPPSSPRRG